MNLNSDIAAKPAAPTNKPLLRGHFHQAMFFISLGALSLLLSLTDNQTELVSIGIYAVCVLSMFGISTLYHRVNWSVKNRALFRKFDHSAIFLMIAGTFTPIAVLGLSEDSAFILLAVIWSIAGLGIVKSIWLTNLPKLLNASLYIVASYVVLPYLGELSDSLGSFNIWLLGIGGIIYSVGAVIYALKKPDPFPKYFGHHEIFHLMVNIAASLHFVIIYSLIQN